MNELLDHLILFLNSVEPLTPEAENDIRGIFILKKIPKKTLLVTSGQIVNKVWYLSKGLCRSYFIKDGKEATTWIMLNNFPFTNYRSFLTGLPSYDNIETVEDCVVLETTKNKLFEMYDKHKCANTIGRKLAETYFLRHDEHVTRLLFSSAEERFAFFESTMPDMLERMKLKDVASYLGMTNETLSRIRYKNNVEKGV
jgi:CRP-like cAMP-binding protein